MIIEYLDFIQLQKIMNLQVIISFLKRLIAVLLITFQ